jgi:hypothetical protein
MANFLAIYRAPGLLDAHPQAKAISYWLVNEAAPAVTGPMDRGDVWFYSAQMKGRSEPYSPAETVARIHATLGRDMALEVLETDVWLAHKLIAERYRRDRVFLAGDACHLHPPMGGYGMNQGIGDAVDLGWKLAACLAGWGGPTLLDSYELERKPVHEIFVNEATANYAYVTHHMTNALIEQDSTAGDAARRETGARIFAGKRREFYALGAVLGYSYDCSPVIVRDGSQPAAFDALVYDPQARPGALLPHVWLADGSSLYDHLGAGFCLLDVNETGESVGDGWRLAHAAAGLSIPLTVFTLTKTGMMTLFGARYILVRPDQHVAWRADELPEDPLPLLLSVTGRGGADPGKMPAAEETAA